MIGNPVIVKSGIKLPTLTDPGIAADLLAPKQLIDTEGNALIGTMPEVEQATPSIVVSSAGLITASAVQEAGHVAGGTKSVTQQLAVKTSSDLTASGATVTAPAGYYASAASKSVATATQATPSITVSSAGLITASATQTAGYVSAGTKSATKQLTTKAAATYTPSTVNQTIASGRYLTGVQTIKGDANLLAENIKSGVSLFGVVGSYEGNIKFMQSIPTYSYDKTTQDATLIYPTDTPVTNAIYFAQGTDRSGYAWSIFGMTYDGNTDNNYVQWDTDVGSVSVTASDNLLTIQRNTLLLPNVTTQLTLTEGWIIIFQ